MTHKQSTEENKELFKPAAKMCGSSSSSGCLLYNQQPQLPESQASSLKQLQFPFQKEGAITSYALLNPAPQLTAEQFVPASSSTKTEKTCL